MERQEVLVAMMLVKGIWQEQATDDLTIEAWHLVLESASLPLEIVRLAIVQRAKAGLNRPTPGQIYQEAAMLEREAAERARRSRKLIDWVPSEEERERVKAGFKELIGRLTEKWRKLSQ